MSFMLVIDLAEQSAEIEEIETKDIWSSGNPDGWTYQDTERPHGTWWGLYETENEAKAERMRVLGF